MFFCFDGVDGVGKSTQMKLFCDWLRGLGHDLVTCRDPGSTPLGEAIRQLLLDRSGMQIERRSEMLLYMAARAQMVHEIIQPAIAAGKVVVSDRYVVANIVYQGHAGGLDIDEVRRVGQIATTGIKPSLTLLLDMSVSSALARLDRPMDRMEAAGAGFLGQVRQGFLDEASRCPDDIVVINADQGVDEVQSDIRSAVSSFLAVEEKTP